MVCTGSSRAARRAGTTAATLAARIAKKDATATKFDDISYNEVLSKSLAVADAAAFALCRENKLPIVIFDLMENGNIARAVRGEVIGTLVA